MKRVIFLCALFCFMLHISSAQTVPQGMKYQAVARDLNGQVLADQTMYLKISLYSDPARKDVAYVELHKVVTSTLGLFDLTIGGGQSLTGSFDKVPWSSDEIWIEVAIQAEDETDFTVISNSRMLSVPYAFHAATASSLAGAGNRSGNDPGIPSQTWSLFGNSNSDPSKDKLGTTDYEDLVLVTDNLERMRIFANGDISISNSLHIGEDLTVDMNAYLNAVGGETVNYGDFTVENQSSTLLSGTLTVDLATDLNSSLNVDGVTNLNSSLNVNNGSPTILSGTLRVEDDATFKEHVLLDNASLGSTTPTTGALVVNGGVGIGENLNVAGASKFGGPVDFAGMVSITDLTESTSTTTGALKVAGGVGIGKRLNVGGATGLNSTLNVSGASTLNSTLNVSGASTLNNTLNVSGVTSLTNTTESTTTANGALVVSGGAGIAKNLNVGGTTTLNKELTVKGTGALGGHVASFENTTNGNGIMIKVGAATPHNANNFVTFLNSSGGVVGRIEGENGAADLENNNDYQLELDFLIADIALATGDEAIAIAEEVQAIIHLVAASTSSTACVGLGACVTAPIPSLIVGETAGVVLATANLVVATADLAKAIAEKITFENNYASSFGVTYQSGAGDYAEYLPKLNPGEKFLPGDVVGLRHGFISKNTLDADRIMVISHNPIVLGKMPPEGTEANYEIVAFLGQIPVKIMGPVQRGDYVLSSGYHNGFGVAKNPKHMRIEDYDRILGVAWEGAEGDKINMVNVAVGLNTNDMNGIISEQAAMIEQQAATIDALKTQMGQTNAILAELVPGFKESLQEHDLVVTEIPSRGGEEKTDTHIDGGHDIHILEPGAGDIVYYKVTRDQLEEGIKLAQDISVRAGVNLDAHPFWNRLSSDPAYKAEILDDLEVKLEYAFHTHEALNPGEGK